MVDRWRDHREAWQPRHLGRQRAREGEAKGEERTSHCRWIHAWGPSDQTATRGMVAVDWTQGSPTRKGHFAIEAPAEARFIPHQPL